MIQIITNNFVSEEQKISAKKIIEYNKFSDYKSFDLYDINIIDLNSDNIWRTKFSSYTGIVNFKELKLLKQSLETSLSKVIIVLPQNQVINYNYNYGSYQSKIELKNIPEIITKVVAEILTDYVSISYYEKNITTIQNINLSSDFYFDEKTIEPDDVLIRCNKSNKSNTIKIKGKIILTTLNVLSDLSDKEKISAFLNNIGFLTKATSAPDWIKDISFYSDEKLKSEIEEHKEGIEILEKKIEENNIKLDINEEYKSILYSTGTPLAKQINRMLGEIFALDSEEFVDAHEEDFNFKKDGITFLIETKGLNNEVAGKNVSEAYNHLVIYEDKIEQKGIQEKTKGLFFVASERNKKPADRAQIKERQITIARRNNMLIVDTPTFYKIFEDFCQKKLSSEEILKVFKEQVGLINYE